MTVTFDMDKTLSLVTSQGILDEGSHLVGAPHARIEYFGEGPSEGGLDLACGLLAAVSGGDSAVAGEGNGWMFLQGVQRVDRISRHDTLPPLLDGGDGDSSVLNSRMERRRRWRPRLGAEGGGSPSARERESVVRGNPSRRSELCGRRGILERELAEVVRRGWCRSRGRAAAEAINRHQYNPPSM